MTQGTDMTLDSATGASVEHSGRSHGLHLPAEKMREEVPSFCDVPAADFEMHNRLTHDESS
jgi:hypothetical protein